ncbi:MAG: FMN-binding negative transcriptional regulator [Ferruginibacter sp.]|nr:FMN-binding negative transcriptional regulator [Cytophagales bacterium]
MYIPAIFKETDPETIRTFIREHRFGILVNSVGDLPQATHLPFELVHQGGENYALQTHLARANPQWKSLDPTREVLVIFSGPHGYISPRWYDHVNVPTMNYLAVHVYGKPRPIEDPAEVYAILKRQVDAREGERNPGYSVEGLPEKFLQNEMRALVGLEVAIGRMEASFKLSQNRDEANYRNILDELGHRHEAGDPALREEMRKVCERKGYQK